MGINYIIARLVKTDENSESKICGETETETERECEEREGGD